MEAIQEGFSAFIGGFARIFFISLILWMIGLLVLLFREMFSPGEFVIREYFKKVWKMLLFSFEIAAYGAVVVGPILMFTTEDQFLVYIMVTIDAVILSAIYLYVRKQTGGFSKAKLRMRKERKHHRDWQ
ncbi:hypothetical protein ACFO25_08210 [Paenactinomyces guangxiensis]|uniref:Uncharacterized protein n=1 Tax=Paenactinomyces guangxiensis TaxID=1490290 RepID=A0A7W1WNE7_9BACL|nr:hypothetical protein [Paenactinomyces guangxiensis]MBA4492973.1 hypothetical protein [Paenactinomyces guangxiensis]MBH8590178.1 hypothetical protein [Paenactinomyces guangxiensis]